MFINEISAGGSGDPRLMEAALRSFVETFPLSGIAHFYRFAGDTDKPRVQGTAYTPGATRTTVTGYTAKERQPQFGALDLKIYGDVVETDIAYDRRGYDIGGQRLEDLEEFCEGLGRYVMDALINHDGTAGKIKGFKEFCTDLSRDIIFEGVNGGAVPTGNSSADRKQQHKFREFLGLQISDISGGPHALIMNKEMQARLSSIGLDFVTTSVAQDVFERNQDVTKYLNIPIIDAGFKNDESGQVIDNVEVSGASSDCTSIYVVRFGERKDTTIGTNSGLNVVDNGVVGTKYQTLVEMDIDLAVLKTKSIKRISGLRLSA